MPSCAFSNTLRGMSLCKDAIPLGQPASAVAPIPVPVNRVGALTVFSVIYSTSIAAPPLACLEKLIDTSTWPNWNPLLRRATITKAPPVIESTTNAPEVRELISGPDHLYAGVQFTVDVHMDLKSTKRTNTAAETVHAVERFETEDGRVGYRVVWMYTGLPWLLNHAERVHEFIEARETVDGRTATEYYQWETFGGLIAFIMKYVMLGQVVGGFQAWRDEFKIAVEADHRV